MMVAIWSAVFSSDLCMPGASKLRSSEMTAQATACRLAMHAR